MNERMVLTKGTASLILFALFLVFVHVYPYLRKHKK